MKDIDATLMFLINRRFASEFYFRLVEKPAVNPLEACNRPALSEGQKEDRIKGERRVINKMKTKMAAIFAVLMIALMVSGIGYACWYKYITLNGYVTTGKFDAEFQIWGISWNATYDGGTPVPDDKKTNIAVDAHRMTDPEQFFINITGLYPSITINVHFNITNTGTVPWIVNSTSVIAPGFPGTVVLTPLDIIGTQVDAGGELQANIDVHITNNAAEETDYTFIMTILVVQWNEYPYEP